MKQKTIENRRIFMKYPDDIKIHHYEQGNTTMHKIIFSVLCCTMLLLSAESAWAKRDRCSPSNINYCSKEKTLFGGKTYIKYNVKCKNGRNRTITAWDNRKKWCVGTSKKCSKNQLKTAIRACSS